MMFAMILKELRQTVHHRWVSGFAALLAFAGIALVVGRFRAGVEEWQIFLFHAGVFIFCVVLIALYAHRWKRERGDAALDPMLTTPLAVRQIVFGKFAALYLPIFALLLLALAVDHPQWQQAFFWKKFALDALFFAALASFVPALSSIRTKRGAGFEWSGVFALLLALPLAAQHLLMLLENGNMAAPGQLAVPFYRAFTLSVGLAAVGFLIAFAGAEKPGADRMRDLHVFYLSATLAVPVIFWHFGGENWRLCQYSACSTAANLFLLASLFERGAVTGRQKRSWRFPLFATGSIFVWLWSAVLIAAAGFAAPDGNAFHADLGSWCFCNFYVALVRCCGEKWSPLRRGAAFFAVLILAAVLGMFAAVDPRFSTLSMNYFHYYSFSWKFFGVLLAVVLLLRSREIAGFVKSLLKETVSGAIL